MRHVLNTHTPRPPCRVPATDLAPKATALHPRHAYRTHVSDPFVVAPEKGVWPDAKPFLAGGKRFQKKVFPETPGPGAVHVA